MAPTPMLGGSIFRKIRQITSFLLTEIAIAPVKNGTINEACFYGLSQAQNHIED
jgi:hypothetical protein